MGIHFLEIEVRLSELLAWKTVLHVSGTHNQPSIQLKTRILLLSRIWLERSSYWVAVTSHMLLERTYYQGNRQNQEVLEASVRAQTWVLMIGRIWLVGQEEIKLGALPSFLPISEARLWFGDIGSPSFESCLQVNNVGSAFRWTRDLVAKGEWR